MRLVAIEQLPQSHRVKLIFDDDFVLKTQPELVAELGLYTGVELCEQERQALLAAAGKASAKTRAVRIMAASNVSERTLEKRLVQKGERADDARQAVDWLKQLHLLDDQQTACQLARSAAARGYGEKRIRSILYEKGIPQQYWQQALTDLPDMDESIDRFLARRFQSAAPDEKQIKRAVDALLRRGHSWQDIQSGLCRFHAELELHEDMEDEQL